jgi:hypothetical protein
MTTSAIEALLEKYYEGHTSLGEEKTLREFFTSDKVPDHLRIHMPMFIYFNEEQQSGLDDREFEKKFMDRIMAEQDDVPVVRMHPQRGRFIYAAGIAASIMLLIGLFFTFRNDVVKTPSGQPMNAEMEIAFTNATEALLMVSGNLNNGLNQTARLEIIDKAMQNVTRFSKFYQYETSIINPDLVIQNP